MNTNKRFANTTSREYGDDEAEMFLNESELRGVQMRHDNADDGEEDKQELIQEDDLQSVDSLNEENRHDGEQQHNGTDRDQEKFQLIEHQEETGQQAPPGGNRRPLSLQRSFQLSVEKVKSPTTAEETFLGQMREKKKVADLIARFNAGVSVPDENGPTKKIGGTGAGKVDELCQKFQ
ncbi:hypothetical protein GPALN_014457 [Globodera pallida]|uniref:Uncharacterized protein n=1 Tax=Globodera pallida TaxID=36090 RepID=A0A183C8F1_GLOPA|nr:hypothetical protein GPALN_014457 [Globodera pallida]